MYQHVHAAIALAAERGDRLAAQAARDAAIRAARNAQRQAQPHQARRLTLRRYGGRRASPA